MTEHKKFSGQTTPSIIDTEYQFCNFTQFAPADVGGLKRGVRLFPGDDTPRTFINCNMANCEPPPGSTLVDCNTTVAEWHVPTEVDTITINGESMTLQHYSKFTYGRFNPDTWEYDDLPVPHERKEE